MSREKDQLQRKLFKSLRPRGPRRPAAAGGLTAAADILTGDLAVDLADRIKGPSAIQKRLLDAADADSARDVLYQHTVLCQTCLPFRDPGEAVREWERLNGNVHLKVLAGEAMHPDQRRLVALGLPFGPKARMILMHINQQALRQKSPAIEIQETLTSFVSRALSLDTNGRNMKIVKEQLARLSAASIRFGIVKDGHALTVNSQIVTAFDIWFPKDDRQRVFWPSVIKLSLDYFESLKTHAVPLNEDHIAALSHSALALDIYAWLASRLHRIPQNKPAKVSWVALHAQFGQGYDRVDNFRAAFRTALRAVLSLYRAARVEDLDQRRNRRRIATPSGEILVREDPSPGLVLYNSQPPVPPRVFVTS